MEKGLCAVDPKDKELKFQEISEASQYLAACLKCELLYLVKPLPEL